MFVQSRRHPPGQVGKGVGVHPGFMVQLPDFVLLFLAIVFWLLVFQCFVELMQFLGSDGGIALFFPNQALQACLCFFRLAQTELAI